MATKTTMSLALAQGNGNMVHQLYQDTNLKLFTLNRHMREGETRTIQLTMVEDYELFEGHEVIRETCRRNPTVFQGEYINVHQDRNGHYQVYLKQLELNNGCDAVRIGKAITTELKTAKMMLGL